MAAKTKKEEWKKTPMAKGKESLASVVTPADKSKSKPRKPGECCINSAKLFVQIKHRDPNWTEELKPNFCAVCGLEL